MARYDWEHGTLKLPSKAYVGFKKGLIARHNEIVAADLVLARQLHAELAVALKGRRGLTRDTVVDALRSHRTALEARTGKSIVLLGSWELESLFIEVDDDTGRAKFKALRASAGGNRLLKASAPALVGEGCVVRFLDATRSVTWTVHENNRAVAMAWSSWLGRAFLDALSRVEWVRGTGGEIVGNDEYNREAIDEGGGANYVTRRFGPLGAKEKPAGRRQALRR